MSPSVETFATSPTAITAGAGELPPSLSRRNSRPCTLQIDHPHPGSIFDDLSPDSAKAKLDGSIDVNGTSESELAPLPLTAAMSSSGLSTPCATDYKQLSPLRSVHNHNTQTMHSPCFVHSHLDKGASLADWMRMKQNQTNGGDVGVYRSHQRDEGGFHSKPILNSQTFGVQYPESTSGDSVLEVDDDEEDYAGSLTRQLAETAVGVREMSKQLGS